MKKRIGLLSAVCLLSVMAAQTVFGTAQKTETGRQVAVAHLDQNGKSIDLGGSKLYSGEELQDAMLAVKCQFAAWEDCELHAIRYAGDDANNEKNLTWLNSLTEGANYTQAVELLMDFHTAPEAKGSWEPDHDYKDYQWWLARAEDGDWEIVSFGY